MSREGPVRLLADPRRFYLRLPLTLLGGIVAGCAGLALLSLTGLRTTWRLEVPQHYLGPLVFFIPAFAYVRWVYVPRTALTLDDAMVALTQPLAGWEVAYGEIAIVTVRSALDVGHRAGVSAGVRLRLRDGSVRNIPDVFTVRRRDLAKLIDQRRAAWLRQRAALSVQVHRGVAEG